MAAQLRMNRELAKETLTHVFGMRQFSLRWFPHTVSALQMALRGDAANGFVNIMTVNESWYHWSHDYSSQWSTSRDQVPTQELKKIDSQKFMVTLRFSGHGQLALDNLAKRCKMNSQYFCDVVLEGAKWTVTGMTRESGIEGIMMHLGNCKVHNSAETTGRLEEFHVTRLSHPPYFPNISPCDF
jgi:hypothetical protein